MTNRTKYLIITASRREEALSIRYLKRSYGDASLLTFIMTTATARKVEIVSLDVQWDYSFNGERFAPDYDEANSWEGEIVELYEDVNTDEEVTACLHEMIGDDSVSTQWCQWKEV